MLTGHGRATPLLWKTVASSTLKGNQRRYEYEVLCRLREVLPAGVKVTVRIGALRIASCSTH